MIDLKATTLRYEVTDKGGCSFTVQAVWDDEFGGWEANVAFTTNGVHRSPEDAVRELRQGAEAFAAAVADGAPRGPSTGGGT